MVWLFILAIVIITLLVFIMFVILKKTVNVVNSQTKTYFVDKLQAYDDLIDEKEKKLNEIDELLKNKEKGLIDKNNINNLKSLDFDYNIIDLFNNTEYQDSDILKINKLILEKFDFNHEKLVKSFLENIKDNNKYNFCIELKNKFTSKVIYEIKTLLDDEIDTYMKNILKDDEYEIYLLFNTLNGTFIIDDFVDYLDQLVRLNNPLVTIYVANNKENYDYLGSNIKTVVSDDIYSGIKIVYRNKVYDFSLSERNV